MQHACFTAILILCISIIPGLYISAETVTVNRIYDGDTFTGVNCTKYNGEKIQDSPQNCACKNSIGDGGTFFTSCMYEQNITHVIGCTYSLSNRTIHYLVDSDDLLNKNILQNGKILELPTDCQKLDLKSVDVWNKTNRWMKFKYDVISPDSINAFQLQWKGLDAVVWEELKGQLLRLSLVCSKVLKDDEVQYKHACLLLKVYGKKVYAKPESTTYPYTPYRIFTTTKPISPVVTTDGTTTTTIKTTTKTTTTTATTPTTTTKPNITLIVPVSGNEKDEGSNLVGIIGGVCGGAGFLVLLIIFIFAIKRRKTICTTTGKSKDKNIDNKHVVVNGNVIDHQKQRQKQTEDDTYLAPINWNQPIEFVVAMPSSPARESNNEQSTPRYSDSSTINQRKNYTNAVQPSAIVNENSEDHKEPIVSNKAPKPTPIPRNFSVQSYDNPFNETLPSENDIDNIIPNRKISSAPMLPPVCIRRESEIANPSFSEGDLSNRKISSTPIILEKPRRKEDEMSSLAAEDENFDPSKRKISSSPMIPPVPKRREKERETAALPVDNRNVNSSDNIHSSTPIIPPVPKRRESGAVSPSVEEKTFDPSNHKIASLPVIPPVPKRTSKTKLSKIPSNTSNISDNSGWGDDFDDDDDDYVDMVDHSLKDQQQHPKEDSLPHYYETEDLNRNSLQVPTRQKSRDKKTMSDYQGLKSIKRHQAEAGLYATLQQEF